MTRVAFFFASTDTVTGRVNFMTIFRHIFELTGEGGGACQNVSLADGKAHGYSLPPNTSKLTFSEMIACCFFPVPGST